MSARTRILLPVIALVAACLFLLGTFVFTRTRANLVEGLDARVAGELQRHAPEATNPPPGLPPGEVSDSPLAYVRVDHADSFLTQEPAGDGLRTYALPSVDEFRRAVSRSGGKPFTISANGIHYRALGRAAPTGAMEVELGTLKAIDAAVDSQRRSFLVGGVAMLVALVALIWFVLRLILKPLADMAAVAGLVAAGDVAPRANPRGGEEVVVLARSFNHMVDELDDARRRAEASEVRMRQFVADASHELQTPVTAISTYVELYRSGGLHETGELDQAMGRIGNASRRIGILVDDLALLAALDRGAVIAVEPVELTTLVTDAVADAQSVDGDRTYRVVAVSGDAMVHADADRLRQALDNTLRNVRVHTPAGTTATVTLEGDQERLQLVVADDGRGMPADARLVACDRFTGSGKGAGLGLAITKAIVEAMGGVVALSDAPAGGLAVTFDLPRPPANLQV